jgi:hypothetical protein
MAAEITFDGSYRIQTQECHGGRFITAAEYETPAPSPS